ncbi:MAG: hypothetical protein V3U03_02510, partial [Myxococcota bacterium]
MQSAATALEGFTRSKPAAPGLARRLLALAGDEPAASAEPNLRAFQLLVLLHLAVERASSAIALAARGGSAGHTLLAAGIALVCVASLLAWRKPATARTATFAALAAQLVFVSAAFPHNANHDLLVVLALGLVALLDLRRPEEREVLLQSLRWMTLIILFATGLQKLLHGTYFFGEYLAVRIAHSDSFAALFQYALPEAEFLRLRSLGANPGVAGAALFLGSASGALPEAGTGPYRVHSP